MVTGKELGTGKKVSRTKAATWLAVGFTPVGKVAKIGKGMKAVSGVSKFTMGTKSGTKAGKSLKQKVKKPSSKKSSKKPSPKKTTKKSEKSSKKSKSKNKKLKKPKGKKDTNKPKTKVKKKTSPVKEGGNAGKKANKKKVQTISQKKLTDIKSGNPVKVGTKNGKKGKGVEKLPSTINYTNKQLQKKFKHASDFGVSGNFNNSNAANFMNVLDNHIKKADNVYSSKISGVGEVNVYIKDKNLAVFTDKKGNFISGWRLSQEQLDFHTKHFGAKIK